MKNDMFTNPILNGFYADPSICRVNNDYYMVTSTFCYFPGIPIFHSTDLVNWNQIGHGICRQEQIDYDNCDHSGGIWAPTIRYHKGRFYICFTFMNISSDQDENSICKNFIIYADSPEGTWSDPVLINNAEGIDPSIIFDKDDNLWYISNRTRKDQAKKSDRQFYIMPLDSKTYQPVGEKTVVWDTDRINGAYLEGAHLYYINDWYYLIGAEGGTEYNHSVVMARSKEITGSYEICPRNPIVTHRHLPRQNVAIAATGHADIIQTQNGDWWMVLLGVRPYSDYHINIGRETFLVPVLWDEEGWLVIDSENGLVNEQVRKPDLPPMSMPKVSEKDHFEENILSFIWNTMRPLDQKYYEIIPQNSILRIWGKTQRAEINGVPAFIGRRQQHKAFNVAVELTPDLHNDGDQAGLILVQDHASQYQYLIERNGQNLYIKLYQICEGNIHVLKEEIIKKTGAFTLYIDGSTQGYSFYWKCNEENKHISYEDADPTVLSVTRSGAFTGAYIGMYVYAVEENGTKADFDWFLYRGNYTIL